VLLWWNCIGLVGWVELRVYFFFSIPIPFLGVSERSFVRIFCILVGYLLCRKV